VNTAILGAFIRATEAVSMASIEKAIRERFSNSEVDINLAAITQTYEITKLEKIK
jgi:Pyruvate/2-oxoacid:ferredoxin oxidoreductase gamma subunit